MLLVTRDHELRHEVQRVAAGVSVPVSVIGDPREALTPWQGASIVLVGGDCTVSMSRLGPAHRAGVSVVNAGLAPPEVFRSAFELGARQVVELPTSHDWLVEALADSGTPDDERGRVVGFLSAAGGSGASSLAAATACLGSERSGAALVDLDPVGVGIERLLGYDGPSVTTWATLGDQTLAPQALRESLPLHDGVHLVGFGESPPRSVEAPAASAVLAACRRAFDLTVVDVPRSLDRGAFEALDRCDLLVVVCPLSVAAALSGLRLINALTRTDHIVVVTRAGPRSVEPTAVADTLEIPLLVDVSDQRGLDEVLACGGSPLKSRGGGLRRAALAVLDQTRLIA